jgi:hypothetical protein
MDWAGFGREDRLERRNNHPSLPPDEGESSLKVHCHRNYVTAIKRGHKSVCGTVNAKNRYGAYVGRTYFVATLIGDEDNYFALSFMDGPDRHPLAEAMCLLRLSVSSER